MVTNSATKAEKYPVSSSQTCWLHPCQQAGSHRHTKLGLTEQLIPALVQPTQQHVGSLSLPGCRQPQRTNPIFHPCFPWLKSGNLSAVLSNSPLTSSQRRLLRNSENRTQQLLLVLKTCSKQRIQAEPTVLAVTLLTKQMQFHASEKCRPSCCLHTDYTKHHYEQIHPTASLGLCSIMPGI